MKEIVYSSKAKKDIKKIQHDPEKRDALHIKDDYLLVWIDDDRIKVVRVGSHSELF